MGSRPSLRWARGLADVGEGWAGREGVGSSLSDAHLRLHLDSSRGPCASVSFYAQSGATNHAPGAVWTQRALLLLRSECGLCRSSQYPGRQTPREGENLSSAHSEIRDPECCCLKLGLPWRWGGGDSEGHTPLPTPCPRG